MGVAFLRGSYAPRSRDASCSLSRGTREDGSRGASKLSRHRVRNVGTNYQRELQRAVASAGIIIPRTSDDPVAGSLDVGREKSAGKVGFPLNVS